MEKGMYCIFDAAANVFYDPMSYNLVTEALRVFEAILRSKDSNIGMFPQDYALYKIGSFNTISGALIPLKEPSRVVSATELLHRIKKTQSDQIDIEDAQDEASREDPYLNPIVGEPK